MGIGVGLVVLGKGTTGGTDMCGAILHHFFPYISLPKLMQLLDVVITSVGIMVLEFAFALYSIIVSYSDGESFRSNHGGKYFGQNALYHFRSVSV